MPKSTKQLSRAQRQLHETEGMDDAQLEEYILSLKDKCGDAPTAELAARYLSAPMDKMYAQGIRIQMRENTLPIGYISGNHIHIIAERLVKWKRGELGVDGEAVTRALVKACETLPGLLADVFKEAAAREL